MEWIFVGAGNMARSLIGGLIASGADTGSITVVDPDARACDSAKQRFAVKTSGSLSEVLDPGTSSGVVIAVKPPVVESVCRNITAISGKNAKPGFLLVISVAAGVRASSMQQWLPESASLVRCMPNTPALLGLGATALHASSKCSAKDRDAAEALLQSAGSTVWVDKESALDAVTALSGSGPAYFFYLIEQMAEAGAKLGLDETSARELAIETAYGAASMARAREHTPSTLRENVTSKGGTTAAALKVFTDKGMPAIVQQAMQAAHDRAVELGDELAP